jgi:2-methylisocitrate lyase-like PEP mutase family enzyme
MSYSLMNEVEMHTIMEKRSRFRGLHETGCFVLPSPWDIGTARMMQQLGFAAIGTTSAGLAWSIGRPQYEITFDDIVEHLASLCEKVDLPVTADFESGFATDPEGVAVNVDVILDTGIAGFSIEDRDASAVCRLYGTQQAAERIQAARKSIDHFNVNVVLVAQTDGLLVDTTSIVRTTDRLVAYAEAGADCLYAPGVKERRDIASMVRAVAPKPLGVLMMDSGMSVAELEQLGVRRISVGGALAQIAWEALLSAARNMRTSSFDGLNCRMSISELNATFGKFL